MLQAEDGQTRLYPARPVLTPERDVHMMPQCSSGVRDLGKSPSPNPSTQQLSDCSAYIGLPRPQTYDLENRLRNLEHLISSIPGGSAAASSTLSSGELDQIRIAAHMTPRSDSSPTDRWLGTSSGTVMEYEHPPWGTASTTTSSVGFGGPLWSSGGVNAKTDGSGNVVLSPQQVSYKSPSTSGQDLLYKCVKSDTSQLTDRDAKGQTKWLGPSRYVPS